MSHTLSTYPSPSKSWLAFPSRYSKETTVTTIIDMLEKVRHSIPSTIIHIVIAPPHALSGVASPPG